MPPPNTLLTFDNFVVCFMLGLLGLFVYQHIDALTMTEGLDGLGVQDGGHPFITTGGNTNVSSEVEPSEDTSATECTEDMCNLLRDNPILCEDDIVPCCKEGQCPEPPSSSHSVHIPTLVARFIHDHMISVGYINEDHTKIDSVSNICATTSQSDKDGMWLIHNNYIPYLSVTRPSTELTDVGQSNFDDYKRFLRDTPECQNIINETKTEADLENMGRIYFPTAPGEVRTYLHWFRLLERSSGK